MSSIEDLRDFLRKRVKESYYTYKVKTNDSGDDGFIGGSVAPVLEYKWHWISPDEIETYRAMPAAELPDTVIEKSFAGVFVGDDTVTTHWTEAKQGLTAQEVLAIEKSLLDKSFTAPKTDPFA